MITGGSKGIGLATAKTFTAEGTALHLAARSAENLQQAKKEIEDEFDVSVSIYAVDLSNGDTVRELADKCREVEILINNAGAIAAGSLNNKTIGDGY